MADTVEYLGPLESEGHKDTVEYLGPLESDTSHPEPSQIPLTPSHTVQQPLPEAGPFSKAFNAHTKGNSALGLTHPEQDRAGEQIRQKQDIDKRLATIQSHMDRNPEVYKGLSAQNVLKRDIEAQRSGTAGDVTASAVDPFDMAAFVVGGGSIGIIKAGLSGGTRMLAAKAIETGLEATVAGLAQIPIGQTTESIAETEWGKRHPEIPIAFNLLANGAMFYGMHEAMERLKTTTTWRRLTIPERNLVVRATQEMKSSGMSEGEIARKQWQDPSNREALLKKWVYGPEDVPVSEPPLPEESNAIPKPPAEVKPEPEAPKQSKYPFRPAIRTESGEIVEGVEGGRHSQIDAIGEHIFITDKGIPVPRKDADIVMKYTHPEVYEEWKAENPEGPVHTGELNKAVDEVQDKPDILASAIGKPEEVDTLDRMGVPKEKQPKFIVDDAVKNPLVAAEIDLNKGNVDKAKENIEKAQDNGNKLILADGPLTENAVDPLMQKAEALNKKIKEKVPPGSTEGVRPTVNLPGSVVSHIGTEKPSDIKEEDIVSRKHKDKHIEGRVLESGVNPKTGKQYLVVQWKEPIYKFNSNEIHSYSYRTGKIFAENVNKIDKSEVEWRTGKKPIQETPIGKAKEPYEMTRDEFYEIPSRDKLDQLVNDKSVINDVLSEKNQFKRNSELYDVLLEDLNDNVFVRAESYQQPDNFNSVQMQDKGEGVFKERKLKGILAFPDLHSAISYGKMIYGNTPHKYSFYNAEKVKKLGKEDYTQSDEYNLIKPIKISEISYNSLLGKHKSILQQVISDGREIPDSVKADYPELFKPQSGGGAGKEVTTPEAEVPKGKGKSGLQFAIDILKKQIKELEKEGTGTNRYKAATDKLAELEKLQRENTTNEHVSKGDTKAKDKKALTLTSWINSKGGMRVGNMTGEIKDVLANNPQARFLKRKDGKFGIDQLARMAYEEGLIKDEDPQTLLDALSDPKWQKPETLEDMGSKGTKDIEITPSAMPVGSKFKIDGEMFKVTDVDADTGETTVKDGKTFVMKEGETLDVNEIVDVPRTDTDFEDSFLTPPEEVKAKPKKPVEQDMFGASGQALEGKLTTKEVKETPLEAAQREAENKKYADEQAKKQTSITLDNLGLQQLYEGISDYVKSGKPQDAIDHVTEVGKRFYSKGRKTFDKFTNAMRGYLGDMWSYFKGKIRDIWNNVIKWNRSLGERGMLGLDKDKEKPFYSQLQRVLSNQLPEQVSPTLFNKIINANREGIRGIKPEEIADAKATVAAIFGDKKSMPKKEILDYLKAVDRTDVQDVTLGSETALSKNMRDWLENERDIPDNPEGWLNVQTSLEKKAKQLEAKRLKEGMSFNEAVSDVDYWELADEAGRLAEGLNKQGSTTGQLHFPQYTEPGAIPGSYREQFVTAKDIPSNTKLGWLKMDAKEKLRNAGFKQSEASEIIDEIVKASEQRKTFTFNEDPRIGNALGDMWNEIHDEVDARRSSGIDGWQDGHSQYSDVKNPIVRIRYNDRVIPDNPELMEYKNKLKAKYGSDEDIINKATDTELSEMDRLGQSQVSRFIEEIQGPSKENEKKMPEIYRKYRYQIGLKRILQGIAEENVQRAKEGKTLITKLAWTTGEMQAERYYLSKQVSSIGYQKRGDLYNVTVWDKQDKQVWQNQSATAADVEATLGKDILKKMESGEGNAPIPGKNLPTYLTGLDLKVGGEGLKRLYNETIPKFLEKYTGEKVGNISLKTGSHLKAIDKGGTWWVVDDKDNAIGEITKTMAPTSDEAIRIIEKQEGFKTSAFVEAISINHELQSSILEKGQPLFSIAVLGTLSLSALSKKADASIDKDEQKAISTVMKKKLRSQWDKLSPRERKEYTKILEKLRKGD